MECHRGWYGTGFDKGLMIVSHYMHLETLPFPTWRIPCDGIYYCYKDGKRNDDYKASSRFMIQGNQFIQ